MFSKATLVKYLHICWPLAVDITHNRERKAPNALIHWTSALLLLQRRKKGSLLCFSTASAALSLSLFFFSPLFSVSFVFSFHHSVPKSTLHPLFVQLLYTFPVVFFSSGAALSSSQIHTLSFIRFLSVNHSLLEHLSSSLSSSNRFYFHLLPTMTSLLFVLLCPVLQQSFIYVTMTSNTKPFSLSLPKSRTSSCFIHWWAWGETSKAVWQPPDPSSVIWKGKSTLLIRGGVSRGWGAGMDVVILVLGGVRGEKG